MSSIEAKSWSGNTENADHLDPHKIRRIGGRLLSLTQEINLPEIYQNSQNLLRIITNWQKTPGRKELREFIGATGICNSCANPDYFYVQSRQVETDSYDYPTSYPIRKEDMMVHLSSYEDNIRAFRKIIKFLEDNFPDIINKNEINLRTEEKAVRIVIQDPIQNKKGFNFLKSITQEKISRAKLIIASKTLGKWKKWYNEKPAHRPLKKVTKDQITNLLKNIGLITQKTETISKHIKNDLKKLRQFHKFIEALNTVLATRFKIDIDKNGSLKIEDKKVIKTTEKSVKDSVNLTLFNIKPTGHITTQSGG